MIRVIPNLHPLFVRFPVALISVSAFFHLAAMLLRERPQHSVAKPSAVGAASAAKPFANKPAPTNVSEVRPRYAALCAVLAHTTLWLGALAALPTVALGWLASNSVNHDEAGHAAMLLHRAWALATLAVLLLLAGWDAWKHKVDAIPVWPFVGAAIAAWMLVASTAWHGGELVYRHGLGVMSLPQAEGPGHTHEHGAGHGDMPVQGEAVPHEGGYSHDDAANGEHPHDAGPDRKAPAADGADRVPGKTGHAHAQGTPPHED